MCRGVWALAVGPDEEACKALRRAAGADVQVIAMATSVSQVQEALADVQLDVAILDARTTDSFGIASLLVRRPIAVVWIGPDAPHSAHATADAPGEDLSGLVTKALLARRA